MTIQELQPHPLPDPPLEGEGEYQGIFLFKLALMSLKGEEPPQNPLSLRERVSVRVG
jgi:hypothetical protein